MSEWKFPDPPNVAAITTRKVVSGEDWIAYVSHDEDDGAWQFHGCSGGAASEADAALVSLRKIVAMDPSVQELADLPLGWYARRDTKESSWQREKSM